MSSLKFDKLINIVVLQKEGYWTADPNDPGALTIWGIASAYWPKEVEAMKVMSQANALVYAKEFYYNKYWLPLNAENLDDHLALALLDGSINQGEEVMAEWVKGLGEQISLDKINSWRMCKYIEDIEKKFKAGEGIENYPHLANYCFDWMQRLKEIYRWNS